MIWHFTTRGLIPLLKSSGYTIGVTNQSLSSGIASILFHNRACTLLGTVNFAERNDYSIEHKQHYNHVLSPKRWADFWGEWSFWEDVDEVGTVDGAGLLNDRRQVCLRTRLDWNRLNFRGKQAAPSSH
jgi:hypothetical protein